MAATYPIIKSYILKNIDNGVYTSEKMLPPEREFTEQFNVSRMTVRRAFDELIQDGILIRKKGSGVFVAPNKQTRSIDKISFQKDEQLKAKYGKINIKVLSLKTVKDHPLAKKYLLVDSQEEVYQLKRVQYGGKTPLVHENIFFPKKFFPDLESIDCSQSVSEIICHSKGNVTTNHNRIEIEADTVNKKFSSLLAMSVGDPILKIINIEMNDQVVMYAGIDSMPGDVFKFVQEINK